MAKKTINAGGKTFNYPNTRTKAGELRELAVALGIDSSGSRGVLFDRIGQEIARLQKDYSSVPVEEIDLTKKEEVKEEPKPKKEKAPKKAKEKKPSTNDKVAKAAEEDWVNEIIHNDKMTKAARIRLLLASEKFDRATIAALMDVRYQYVYQVYTKHKMEKLADELEDIIGDERYDD